MGLWTENFQELRHIEIRRSGGSFSGVQLWGVELRKLYTWKLVVRLEI